MKNFWYARVIKKNPIEWFHSRRKSLRKQIYSIYLLFNKCSMHNDFRIFSISKLVNKTSLMIAYILCLAQQKESAEWTIRVLPIAEASSLSLLVVVLFFSRRWLFVVVFFQVSKFKEWKLDTVTFSFLAECKGGHTFALAKRRKRESKRFVVCKAVIYHETFWNAAKKIYTINILDRF